MNWDLILGIIIGGFIVFILTTIIIGGSRKDK